MKVQVKDFQIIKHAEAEFVPGLNVIVGPSNNGKTSFIKAMKALMYTEPGSTPIRHGTQAYVVGIQHEGRTVILQKGLKDSAYLVDGEKFTKYGTTTPEAVSNALRIRELELNGKKEKINFWDQMNYPFLLDKTSTELFRFIVDSGEDDQVSAALKDMVSDRQGINKEINQIQGSIIVLDEQLSNKTADLFSLKPRVEISKKIIEMQPRIANLKQLENSLNRIKELSEKRKILESKVKETQEQYSLWEKYSISLTDLFEKYTVYSKTLAKISTLNQNINQNSRELEVNKKLLANIENVSEVNLMPLIEVRNKLVEINSKLTSLKNYQEKDFINVDTKKLEEELLSVYNQRTHMNTVSNLIQTKAVKDEFYNSINFTLEKVANLSSLIKVCPYCGQAIHNI